MKSVAAAGVYLLHLGLSESPNTILDGPRPGLGAELGFINDVEDSRLGNPGEEAAHAESEGDNEKTVGNGISRGHRGPVHPLAKPAMLNDELERGGTPVPLAHIGDSDELVEPDVSRHHVVVHGCRM